MELTVFDVDHGACALLRSRETGRIALIDCGHNQYTGWTPAWHIRNSYKRDTLDYLIITNTDEDHYSNLSDLLQNVQVKTLMFNADVSAETFRSMKRKSGPLSRDAEAYLQMRKDFIYKVDEHFNDSMGGILEYRFSNSPREFNDFNNLSIATFFRYGEFQILFPGDLERPGWLKLLEISDFRALLSLTTVLVAPHHGRINQNYCEEIFEFLSPELVVISDKRIVHQTQLKSASEYRKHVREPGLFFPKESGFRKVLTTRRDGAIHFSAERNGNYTVSKGA